MVHGAFCNHDVDNEMRAYVRAGETNAKYNGAAANCEWLNAMIAAIDMASRTDNHHFSTQRAVHSSGMVSGGEQRAPKDTNAGRFN